MQGGLGNCRYDGQESTGVSLVEINLNKRTDGQINLDASSAALHLHQLFATLILVEMIGYWVQRYDYSSETVDELRLL